ncbi:MAG TPA: tetratricopeptide repeat protein [Gemmatimonadales bacterium]|nr:tetratricopeptide repeat protein [Gemmatimonadales bacterium]
MANLEKYKERARKFELKEQWAKAIEEYVGLIEEMEAAPDAEADLSIYNRVGDLYQKVGQGQNAIVYYERAVDKYHETGLDNNAIALCRKVLRIAPGRAQVYLKLGMLYASSGILSEAKTHLLEYADRMQKAGQLEEAFKALKKFAEMTPGQDDIWSVLAQQARATARTPDQKQQVEKLLAEFENKDRAHHRKSRLSRHMITGEALPEEKPAKKGELIFLDLEPTRPSRPEMAPPEAAAPPTRAAAAETESTALEIEPTSLVPEVEAGPELPMLEIEATTLPGADELAAPPLGLEPTSFGTIEPPAAAEPAAPSVEELDFGEPQAPAAPELEIAEEAPEAAAEAPAGEASGTSGLPLLDLGEVEAPPEETAEPEMEFLDVSEVVTAPSIEELESRVATNASDWGAHRLLGEALIEVGQRDRAFSEFDTALEGLEQSDDLDGAYAIAEELLRLDPNSVRYHQKCVELAYRQGDRPRLAGAYLELADALLRSGEAEKALAVYERVLEHDPGNQRARTGIETLGPAAPYETAAPEPAPAAAAPVGGYVDLGALLLEDEGPKDTRMRIEDEEPSGDEEQDFQTMLTAFKKGVEANVEESDFQSHYDLGVAYKEMGLLDEAIAEFQKALRGTEGRLKASEALGLCFFEKGQFTVAETILRRALELPAAGDADRVGLLYWLGRTQEELGKSADALASYNRVFAVDITFQDVSQRVKALSRATV